ncbi:MAG: hypothetical protein ACXW25_01355 [Rhodospirillales bacterium]
MCFTGVRGSIFVGLAFMPPQRVRIYEKPRIYAQKKSRFNKTAISAAQGPAEAGLAAQRASTCIEHTPGAGAMSLTMGSVICEAAGLMKVGPGEAARRAQVIGLEGLRLWLVGRHSLLAAGHQLIPV